MATAHRLVLQLIPTGTPLKAGIVGQSYLARLRSLGEDNAPLASTGPSLTAERPDLSLVTLAAGDWSANGTGVWEANFVADAPGEWTIRAAASGPVPAAAGATLLVDRGLPPGDAWPGWVAVANSAAVAAASALVAQAAAQAAAATIPVLNDRVSGRRLSDTDRWPMIRATPAWGFGATGALEEAPIDTLRWEFDPATLAPLGPAFAGTRTNACVNARLEGASVGVIGSGGALPTGQTVSGAGVTVSVVSVTALPAGHNRVGVRYQAASAPASIVHTIPCSGSLSVGGTLAASMFCRVAGGSLANITAFQFGTNGVVAAAPVISTTRQRLITARIFASGGAASWTARLACTAGQPVDITIEYDLPSAELDALFPSAPILPPAGTPGASTRAQGNVSIPVQQLGQRWSRRQGVLIVDWNSQPGAFTSAADADWFGLISWGDGTANERLGLLVSPAHTAVQARVTAGGAVQTASAVTIAAPAAGVTTRAAVAWDLDAGFLQVAARGVAGNQVALTALPIPGLLMPGRFGASNPHFGGLPGLDLRPAAVFGTALAALTA